MLHSNQGVAVLLSNLIDRANIGVVQGRSSLRLTLETGQSLGVFSKLILEKLESCKAMERRVLRLVHHSHPTTTEFLNDAIVRDSLADHWGRLPYVWNMNRRTVLLPRVKQEN